MQLKLKFAALLCCLLVLVGVGTAQNITGSIAGTVKDPSGAAIPNATVTITDTDKNVVVRKVTTDANGNYSAPLLPIGRYSLSVEASGFKRYQQNDIPLNVSDQLAVNPVLAVGSAGETVNVTAEANQVELQNATAAGLISGTQIRELSLNNRNYEQLVALMPGVSFGGSDSMYIGTTNFDSGSSNQVRFAVNGNRMSQNNWTVDGADNVDRGANLTLLNYPSVDSIQEFKVLRGLYSADSGRNAGGQVEVVTRGGTANFHGGAWEFFRNDVLNANRYFNKPNAVAPTTNLPRSPLRYNNFGYNIGGPVYIPGVYNTEKKKTFFFFNEEWRRVITSVTQNVTLPTANELKGIFDHPVCTAFSAPVGGTCTTTGTTIANIDPTAAAYIKDIWGKLPTAPSSGSRTVFVPVTNVFNARQELVRVDHNFTDNLALMVRYLHDDIPTVEPGGLFTGTFLPGVATTQTNSPGRTLVLKLTDTLSPTLIAEAGYNESYGAILSRPTGLESKQNSPDVNPTLPFPVSLGRIPTIGTITGLTGFADFGPYNDVNRNHAVFGNVTKVWGAHTFKAGISYNHYNKFENSGNGNQGNFTFNNASGQPTTGGNTSAERSWANFLLGRAASFSQASQDLIADPISNQIEWYAADNWRFRNNLTLDLGLRYSWYGQPSDGFNRISNFDPSRYNPANAPQLVQSGANIGQLVQGTGDPLNGIITGGVNSPFGKTVLNENVTNFAPRIGVAWDPTGNGKMSIRTGYGIYFDTYAFSTAELTVFNNPPFVNNPSTPPTLLGNPAGGGFNINNLPKTITALPSNSKAPYVQQWSLDVQQELLKGWLFDVGYYASKGTHLIGRFDINQIPVGTAVAAGFTAPAFITANGDPYTISSYLPFNLLRPYRGYGPINKLSTAFGSNYNSLQASLRKQFSGDNLIALNYTWSRNLTDAQADTTAPQNTYNPRGDYGLAQFDRTHIFNANFVYELPWFKNQGGLLGYTVGGWEFSGIINFDSGIPLTITTSSYDAALQGILGASASGPRPDQIADPKGPQTVLQWFNTAAFVNPPKGTNRPGNEQRGVIRGPGFEKIDFSMFKNFRITESTKLQFRAEAFNVLNHTNFDGVGLNNTLSTYGQITSTRDPRVMQLGLKLNF